MMLKFVYIITILIIMTMSPTWKEIDRLLEKILLITSNPLYY